MAAKDEKTATIMALKSNRNIFDKARNKLSFGSKGGTRKINPDDYPYLFEKTTRGQLKSPLTLKPHLVGYFSIVG